MGELEDCKRLLWFTIYDYKKDIYFETQALMPVYKINVFFSLMI